MSEIELVDVFDESGEQTGTVTREVAESMNHSINIVIVFIFNSLGEVCIQKRPQDKTFGGMWDASACGAVKKGEEPEDAALREQREEMGYVSGLMLVDSFTNVSVSNDGQQERKLLAKLFIGQDDRVPEPNADVDEFQKHNPAALLELIAREPDLYVPTLGPELIRAIAHQHLLAQ